MNRRWALLVILMVLPTGLFAQHKNVWNGVYADTEAARGQAMYEQTCVNCHGVDLAGGASQGGPQLAGDKFMENWREDTVETLFLKIRNTMPRRGFQGSDRSLTDREALDLVAYILKKNGFPAGSELDLSGLANVWIEQQTGPKPLPNRAQVQAVGCLQPDGDNWVLANSAQPTRLRGSGETIEPDVLKAAQAKPLGSTRFPLLNLLMLGAFTPETHTGHKMLAQGVLIRQGTSDRISVTKLEMLSDKCQ